MLLNISFVMINIIIKYKITNKIFEDLTSDFSLLSNCSRCLFVSLHLDISFSFWLILLHLENKLGYLNTINLPILLHVLHNDCMCFFF